MNTIERLEKWLVGFETKRTISDRQILNALPALIAVAKAAEEQAKLAATEKRYREEYPAGTCNAEDAWHELGTAQNKNEKAMREALATLKEQGNG